MDNQNLDEIKNLLAEINSKVECQNKRMEILESRMLAVEQSKNGRMGAEELLPMPVPEQEQQKTENNFAEQPKEIKENFEERLGGRWFAKIGIAVIFIGISLFLKYAFDNNWINEAGRVFIGIIAGLGLLAAGEMLIKKYFNYGQIISGGGLAILYLSIFAAFDFYHLIPSYAAFIAMAAVTAAAMFLSLRYDAMSLIMVAIAGGFAAPLLCSSGVNNQIGLFSYLMILDLAIFAISLFKKWRKLNLLGFIGTALLFLIWYGKFYTADQLPVTIFFLTLFFLIYSLAPLIYNLYREEISAGEDQVLTLFSGAAYFASVYGITNAEYHAWMGAAALALGIYYLIWAYLARSVSPQDENLFGFLAFLSAGFIAIAIPIQFKYYTITIGWMAEALVLFYIGARQESGRISESGKEKQNAIIILGSTAAFLAVFRLLFFDATRILQNEAFLINKRFGIFLFVILCFYTAGYIFNRCIRAQAAQNRIVNLKTFMAVMLIIANFLTIFSLSQEIIDYHDREVDILRVEQDKLLGSIGDYKNRSEIYSGANYQKLEKDIENIEYRSSIVLSLFWLVYAIILLVIGFAGSYKAIRIGGIVLLMLSILKLFFYDLWRLGTLYRIISSMSLGVVLLLISFAYQKYKGKLREII